jgi:hypothetical protein
MEEVSSFSHYYSTFMKTCPALYNPPSTTSPFVVREGRKRSKMLPKTKRTGEKIR